MDTVHVRWNGRRRLVGCDSTGHGVVMDLPVDLGGEGSGTRPIELVLYALGGCTGIDVISILEKQRQRITGFEVVVTGVQREAPPRMYVEVTVEYVVTGYDINPNSLERAIQLSEDKYCSVKAMFGPEVSVKTSYRIIEAELPC